MSRLANLVLAALLVSPAFAAVPPVAIRVQGLSHPSTRDKGPGPVINYYLSARATAGRWRGPAHPATRDWGPTAQRPHVVLDSSGKGPGHPPTRDWGPGHNRHS